MKKLILLCLLALPAFSATGISAAASAWNTAATWKVAEAGAGAIQVTRSANTETTTSYVYSTAFTCTNEKVIEGMVLHLYRVGVTGTVSVALSEDNGVTATKEVTVNASDLPAAQSEVYFTFASTLTCDGGVDYKVGVKESAAGSGAFVYRDGTAGNWFHILQTSTAYGAAPAAADNLHIVGFAVTMDSTDSTDHGTVDIGSGGSLTFGVTAATAYVLKASGDINIWSGGTLNVGTVGATMPSDSTGTILLDCASNVEWGLYVRSGGTFVMQGASKTTWTYLVSDEAVNSTEITTADATSWASGDVIAISSTTRTSSQSEKGDLNGAASGVTLTVHGFGGAGGGLAYAHSGTSPTRAEIVNLTRNVVVHGASAANQTYIHVASGGTVDWDYVEFYWLGSGTGDKRGIDVQTTSAGSFNAAACTVHDLGNNAAAFYVTGGASTNVTIDGCITYNVAQQGLYIAATSGTWTVTNSLFILSAGYGVELQDVGGTFTGNVSVSATNSGMYFAEAAALGTFSNNTSHSGNGVGIQITYPTGTAAYGGFVVWRHNNVGVYTGLGAPVETVRLTFDGITAFGNSSANIWVGYSNGLTLKNIVSNGDSTFSTTYGLQIAANWNVNLRVDNSSFSVASGIKTAHTNDIFITSGVYLDAVLLDSVLSAGTPISGLSTAGVHSSIRFQRYGGAAGDHRSYYVYGTIQTDSVIFRTAAPSERVTPSSAAVKIESARFPKTVANGATAAFSVWVRKSEAADAGGADYNGNQQRLVLKANPALGIDADVVLDTAAAAVGAWEELTGTSAAVTDNGTLEAVVDCDGTAGWINVSDWQTAGATTFWLDGLPAYGSGMVGGAAGGGTRSYPVMQ